MNNILGFVGVSLDTFGLFVLVITGVSLGLYFVLRKKKKK